MEKPSLTDSVRTVFWGIFVKSFHKIYSGYYYCILFEVKLQKKNHSVRTESVQIAVLQKYIEKLFFF